MPSNNKMKNDDGDRWRFQNGDGRSSEQRSRRNDGSISRSISKHHHLPQEFSTKELGKKPTGSPGNGNGGRSSTKNHGVSRPPPPPPPPPYARGRNTSFHSISTDNRSRSLSISRPSSSSQKSKPSSRSRASEARVHANENNNDRRGRSLSIARSSESTSATTATKSSDKPLPLIGTNGERRSRSRPRSRPRSSHDEHQNRQKSSSLSRSSRRSVQDKEEQDVRSRKDSESRRSNSSRRLPTTDYRALFEQKIAENENNALLSSAATTSSNARRRTPSSTNSRRSNSRGRSSRVDKKSATSSATTSSTSESKNTRKFVVEIDATRNSVVQVFEFSENGALPSKQGSTDEPEFVESILRKFSGDEDKEPPHSRSSTSSRGRSSSRSRGTSSSSSLARDNKSHNPSASTTRIIVESDEQNNVIQVYDHSVLPTRQRDQSPFTRRQEEAQTKKDKAGVHLEKHRSSPEGCISTPRLSQSFTSPSTSRRPVAASSRGDKGFISTPRLSQSFTAPSSSRRPVAASSRGGNSQALRSSLRTSLRGGGGASLSQASVSFAADTSKPTSYTAAALETSERSNGSAGSSSIRSSSARSVSFEKDLDNLTRLTSSLTSDDSPRSKSAASNTSEKSGDEYDDDSNDESSRWSVGGISQKDQTGYQTLGGGRGSILKASLISQDHSGCRLDAGKKSDGSGESSLLTSKTSSTLDTSDRSGESSARRSVSFVIDPPDEENRPHVMPFGSIVSQGSASGLSRGRSVLTQPRTRGQSPTSNSTEGSLPPPRQVRSLSRSRNIRGQIDFDPALEPSSTEVTSCEKTFSRVAPVSSAEKMPIQKSLLSHSTAETFVSALTFEEDSFIANETTQAMREGFDPLENSDPLMNSTLTIFESEDDEDEQSLLSDPTFSMENTRTSSQSQQDVLGLSPANKVNVNVMDDSIATSENQSKKQGSRSRLKSMLTRKTPGKRQGTNNATIISSSKSKATLLDTSESTRETLGTEGSSSQLACLEGARQNNSLVQHPTFSSSSSSQGDKGRGKLRLSKLLNR